MLNLHEMKEPEIILCKLSVTTKSFYLTVMAVFRAEPRGLRVAFVKACFLKVPGCEKQGAFQT